MAEKMMLQVIKPDGEFYKGEVTMVEFTSTDGDLGIYPKHIPVTTGIAPGILKIHEEGGVKEAALLSGFVQILPDQVTILAESCEWPDEIDAVRANEAKIRAERRLKDLNGEVDMERAENALQRSEVRLSMAKDNKK